MSQSSKSTPVTSSTTNVGSKSSTSSEMNSKGLKICCACPETKRARDECVVLNGEENCMMQIEAHKVCLRKEGFKV